MLTASPVLQVREELQTLRAEETPCLWGWNCAWPLRTFSQAEKPHKGTSVVPTAGSRPAVGWAGQGRAGQGTALLLRAAQRRSTASRHGPAPPPSAPFASSSHFHRGFGGQIWMYMPVNCQWKVIKPPSTNISATSKILFLQCNFLT